VSLTLHLVYRTGRGRLARHEHTQTVGRGPAGSGTAAGMLLLDAGAMDPIQFRPAATSQPGRAGPLS